MNIQGVFQNLHQSIRDYCIVTQQSILHIVVELRNLRNDPEFFYKTCRVAFSTFQLIMIQSPGTDFSRLSFALLATVDMQDVYRIIQRPRNFFFPITAKNINEDEVLEDLTPFLYKKFQEFSLENQNVNQDNEQQNREDLRTMAKNCLTAQLKQMDGKDDAYRNLDEFKEVLENRLNEEKIKDVNHPFHRFPEKKIDLSDLQVGDWKRPTPFLEKIIDFNWLSVEIGGIFLSLQGWNLINTAKWAICIGQYSLLQWLKNFQLGTCVLALINSAFALKLIDAAIKLHDDHQLIRPLTPEQRCQTRWDMVTSLAETILFSTIFLKHIEKIHISNGYIQCFAILAKTLGLFSIVSRSKRQFFLPVAA